MSIKDQPLKTIIKHYFPVVKKAKTFLYTINLMFNYERQNPFVETIFQQDATASGIQMISMFLHDPILGRQCNIQGTEPVYVYQEFLNSLNQSLQEIEDIVIKFDKMFINPQKPTKLTTSISKLFNILNQAPENFSSSSKFSYDNTLRDFFSGFLLSGTLIDNELPGVLFSNFNPKEHSWFYNEVCFSAGKIILKLFEEDSRFKDNLPLTNVIQALKKTTNKFLKQDYALAKQHFMAKKNILQVLLLYHSYKTWNLMLNKNKALKEYNVLNNRSAIKIIYMITGYNAGYSTKYNKLFENLVKILFEYGIAEINVEALKYITRIITFYFEKYARDNIGSLRAYKDLLNAIVQRADRPISCTTEFYKWVLAISKTEVIRLNVPSLTIVTPQGSAKKTPRTQPRLHIPIYQDNGEPLLDIELMCQKISAIFAHSADKEIVFCYLKQILGINQQIIQTIGYVGGCLINCSTNHDSFGISMSYAPIQNQIIDTAYRDVLNKDLLANFIKENIPAVTDHKEFLENLNEIRFDNQTGVKFDFTLNHKNKIKI